MNVKFNILTRSSLPLVIYRQAEIEKQLADSLLHDIIPVHVVDQIKGKGEYSQSHKDVGVVFISITNFDDFYDESFEGGLWFIIAETLLNVLQHCFTWSHIIIHSMQVYGICINTLLAYILSFMYWAINYV